MTSDLHKDFTQGSISHMDFWNVTHKYVTLGSGGVDWATGYQYHQQTAQDMLGTVRMVFGILWMPLLEFHRFVFENFTF